MHTDCLCNNKTEYIYVYHTHINIKMAQQMGSEVKMQSLVPRDLGHRS